MSRRRNGIFLNVTQHLQIINGRHKATKRNLTLTPVVTELCLRAHPQWLYPAVEPALLRLKRWLLHLLCD